MNHAKRERLSTTITIRLPEILFILATIFVRSTSSAGFSVLRCYRSTFCNILQRSRMTHIGLGKRLVTLLQLGLCLSMILSTDFELIMIMITVDYDY